jgi:hypothetical protein
MYHDSSKMMLTGKDSKLLYVKYLKDETNSAKIYLHSETRNGQLFEKET